MVRTAPAQVKALRLSSGSTAASMKNTAQANNSAAIGVTIARAMRRLLVVDSFRSIRWNRNETQTPSSTSPKRTSTICLR